MPWWSPRDLEQAVVRWTQDVARSDALLREHPDRFRVVRYEALVERPAEELAAVMAFLGEEFEPGQLSTAVESRVVLPRSAVWKGRALEEIGAAVDGPSRRERAGTATVQAIEGRIGDELRSHGYM